MFKRVYVVANKGSGGKGAALSDICGMLDDTGVMYDLQQISSNADLKKAVSSFNPQRYDAVFVYGGDGSVLRMAHRLAGSKLPLCVLPGGTNNGLAASFRQPSSPQKTLQAVLDGRYNKINIDVAYIDGKYNKPLVYDLHYGIFAKVVAGADRQLKQRIGSMAYAVQAIKELQVADMHDVTLALDGRKRNVKAVMCYISNAGAPNLFGMPIFSERPATDGRLDIAIIKTMHFWPLFLWYLQRRWFGRAGSSAIEIRQAKKVDILKAPTEVFYDDITTHITPPFTITVKPKQLSLLVPRRATLAEVARTMWLRVKANTWRLLDQTRRVVFGMSAQRFSQVDDHLFIGGQPGRFFGARSLRRWNIAAVVNMRLSKPRNIPNDVDVLHLPTPNYYPIALTDLQRGAEFIDARIKKGQNVYVHCQAGEGRAASMAIAYLVSQGMFLRDAIIYVKDHRVFIRPNKKQLQRLREFARQVSQSKNNT